VPKTGLLIGHQGCQIRQLCLLRQAYAIQSKYDLGDLLRITFVMALVARFEKVTDGVVQDSKIAR
jgi:hypothetical protein